MAINWCVGSMRCAVECDRVCSDQYPPTGLTSLRPAPFMVERFIKPPVNLRFYFPCCIEIQSIIIHTRVGAQGSNGIEIYTSTCSPADISLSNNRLLDKNKVLPLARTKSCSTVSQRVATARDNTGIVFKFVNENYRENFHLKDKPRMVGRVFSDSETLNSKLYHRNMAHLQRVDSVTVRIVGAVSSGLAALKWIEVWGNPARSTPAIILHKIKDIISQYEDSSSRKHIKKSITDPQSQDNVSDISVDTNGSVSDAVNIPSVFLDALTCEIMALPMLLPSGQTIDNSTLEKHASAEANWGRSPSDPFTGQIFTSVSKPVPNSALKARIDDFLLKHGDAIHVHKVGNNSARATAKIASASVLVESDDSLSINNETEGKNRPTTSNSYSEQPSTSKRKFTDDENPTETKKKVYNRSKNETDPVFVDLTREESHILRKKHQDSLSQSLDSALGDALSSLPSFRPVATKFQTSSMISECRKEKTCHFCDRTEHQASSRYQLPCKHIVCHSCAVKLRKQTKPTCLVCYVPADAKNIVRIHSQ